MTGPKDSARFRTIEAQLTVGVFVVALVLWCIASIVLDPGLIAKSENRYIARLPDADLARREIAAYRTSLADHLSDRVALRDTMISLHARAKVGLFGSSPSESLIVGKDGWFFLNDEAAVAQYRGIAKLDAGELETWKRVLEQRRDWLAQRGIPFVLVLVPNKHQIYPEYMPTQISRLGTDEQHVQLARYLAEHSDLAVVDLMPTLLRAKKSERVFHKTDTHWNDVGAYAGYKAILAAVRDALPNYADRLKPTRVIRREFSGQGIGLTSMVGLSAAYPEAMIELDKATPQARSLMADPRQYARFEREQKPLALGVPGAALPRAVVFRDSFSNALIPYLSENFRRVLFVWTRDVGGKPIEREQPDIVIQEIAGRLLDRTPLPIR